jgi:hypothetical protein
MKRNKFSLSNYKICSADAGTLFPVGLTEVIPGDTIQQATSSLVRVTPLNAPVMHPVDIRIHHWFVPHRLVWNDWEEFHVGYDQDGAASTKIHPTITFGSAISAGDLADYLGLPVGSSGQAVNALPFRGYALIWNTMYRDQDLQSALTIDKTDGADSTTSTDLKKINWEKDYFTSARVYTQKDSSATSIPLGTSAVVKTSASDGVTGAQEKLMWRTSAAGSAIGADTTLGAQATSNEGRLINNSPTLTSDGYYPTNLYADLASGAAAADINDLREAVSLQKYKEARARYGSRYTEFLAYLGIASRRPVTEPVYLGGGKETISFSEIIQQAPTTSGTEGTGVGVLRGHGLAAMRSNRYRRFFDEAGYVFSLMSIRPRTLYSQGYDKHWLRTTKEDYFQRELQGIGQDEILNKELYYNDSGPGDVFGYQDRYDEYRRGSRNNGLAGDFHTSPFYNWHFGRIFSGDVTLNSSFVECSPTTRTYQQTATDPFQVYVNNSIQARRPINKTGTPGGLL